LQKSKEFIYFHAFFQLKSTRFFVITK